MPSTTETSADDDDEEDAGLWLFSQAGQKEPDEDVQVERLTERHVQDVQLQMGRFWDNDYEAADRVCRERSQHNLVYALGPTSRRRPPTPVAARARCGGRRLRPTSSRCCAC